MQSIYLSFILCFLLLVVFNYYCGRKNLVYPPFLFSVLWLGAFVLYTFSPILIDSIQVETILVFFYGALGFSFGGCFALSFFGKEKPRGQKANASIHFAGLLGKHLLLLLLVVLLPLYFWQIRQFSEAGDMGSFFQSARAAMIQSALETGSVHGNLLFNNLPIFAVYTSFLFLLEKQATKKDVLWYCLSVGIVLAYCVLSTGRVELMAFFTGSIAIYVIKEYRSRARAAAPRAATRRAAPQRRTILRNALLSVAAMLIVIVGLTFLNKDTGQSQFYGNRTGAWDIAQFQLVSYIIGPMAAFDDVVKNVEQYEGANHTFSPLLKVVAAVSGTEYVPPPSNTFIQVPFYTNVYTLYRFYYVDFGFAGTILVLVFWGITQTFLFEKARRGNEFYLFLYVVSLYPLATSTFDDQYSLFFMWVKAIFFGILYFKFLRRVRLFYPSRSRHAAQSGGARANLPLPAQSKS